MKILSHSITALVTLSFAVAAPFGSVAAAAPAAKQERKKGKPATAEILVQDMRKAVGFIGNDAKTKINPKSKQARPFWSAMKLCVGGLAQIEKGIKAKDKNFVQGLDELGQGVIQLNAVWDVIGDRHKDSQIGRGIEALEESYTTFLLHYGPAVARHKKKAAPDAAELARVKKCKAELAALEAKLKAMHDAAKTKSHERAFLHSLLKLAAELDGVDVNSNKSLCKFLYQWDRLEYTLRAFDSIVEDWYPASSAKWKPVGAAVVEMSADFGEETWSYYEGWSYTEETATRYEDYFEHTEAVASVTDETEESVEEFAEHYDEESATEESAADEEEIEQDADEDSADEEPEMDDADDDGIADDAEEEE